MYTIKRSLNVHGGALYTIVLFLSIFFFGQDSAARGKFEMCVKGALNVHGGALYTNIYAYEYMYARRVSLYAYIQPIADRVAQNLENISKMISTNQSAHRIHD